MRSSACALWGDGENVGPSSPPSSWRRLWLCKELKSAKLLAGKVQNLGDFQRPGAWGLGAGCPPYRPQLGPCPCSPLLSAGPVGPTADSEQGREEGTSFTVGLGMGIPGCEFYGILPLTGHGTLGQFHMRLSLIASVMGDEETSLPGQMREEMRGNGSSTALGTWWVAHWSGHEGAEVKG